MVKNGRPLSSTAPHLSWPKLWRSWRRRKKREKQAPYKKGDSKQKEESFSLSKSSFYNVSRGLSRVEGEVIYFFESWIKQFLVLFETKLSKKDMQ